MSEAAEELLAFAVGLLLSLFIVLLFVALTA